MATACGPEGLVEPMVPIGFDQPSPRHSAVEALAQSSVMHPISQQSPRSTLPPPNPPFVFPARPPPSSAPSSSTVNGRRPRSAVESGDRAFSFGDESDPSPNRSPALPAFSFNPGAAHVPDSSMLSPPLSPQSPRTIPPRPSGHGHKRGGSEYVGGSIRGGDAIAVMGTSPTKSESGFASPTFAPPRPAGRRGHAHRRSAALSSHDLSSIMNPNSSNAVPHGNSAPSSPAQVEKTPLVKSSEEASVEKAPSRPTVQENEPEPEHPPPPKATSRTRVGFSDNVEYIPRPLSLVSSDTSSTITARPGHSVSGSISSVVSGPTSTPVEPEAPPPLAPRTSRPTTNSRPSTAGAILERTQGHEASNETSASPRRRNSIPLLVSLGSSPSAGPSAPSPTKTPKRWSFFSLDPFIGTSSPKGSRPASSSSSDSSSTRDDLANSSTENVAEIALGEAEKHNAKAHGKKPGKKQKIVKAWAGSILTRRSKAKQGKTRAVALASDGSAVPVASSTADEEPPADPVTPSSAPVMPVVMVTASPDANQKERPKSVPVADDDGSYPVIDLDAALGPFNTPLPFNPEWEAAQRAGAPAKRKLHSAAGMSHFNGPGGHYHRRAESAPEMAPFEQGRFGIHRFGSSSNMADVFEEEEEEEAGQPGKTAPLPSVTGCSAAPSEPPARASEPQPSPVGGEPTAQTADGADAAGAEVSDSDGSGSQSRAPSASIVEEAPVPHSTAPDAAIFEISAPPRRDHCDSAEGSPRRVVPLRELAPVDVSLQLPSASLAPASPSMTHSSSFPSPRSPMSYDANRVSTAPSSIAEENTFQSLLMGEPGPEVRYSVDADIPSLTSSNSTMTKDSFFSPHPRSSHGNLPGQRPVSFSSAAFSRRRSSLASLSRLISSSHGEKSKLSTEITCDSEPERKPKNSTAKRLGRKLQFWKPAKETAPSTS